MSDLIETGGGYLPGLLQLRRPLLLQDGLHSTDELCSHILGSKTQLYASIRIIIGAKLMLIWCADERNSSRQPEDELLTL